MKKFKSLMFTIIISSLFFVGCGASSSSFDGAAPESFKASMNSASSAGGLKGNVMMDMAIAEDSYHEEAIVEESYTDRGSSVEIETSIETEIVKEETVERKLIKTINLDMETKNFDEFVESIDPLVSSYNGYLESASVNGNGYNDYRINRRANFTIRVPMDKVNELLENFNNLGVVSYKSESVEDVTLHYYDLNSQKEALEVEQERLMDILEKSETIEQIIALEQRLGEVRYELNSLGSSLRVLDNRVDYSTIYLELSEVDVEVTFEEEKTVFQTIAENWEQNIVDLKYFFEDLIINLTSNLAVIALEILIVVGLIWFFAGKKKRKLKREASQVKINDALKNSGKSNANVFEKKDNDEK